jgi:hypothetical protein
MIRARVRRRAVPVDDQWIAPTKQVLMTDTSLDELGPVDYVVVEFPAG